jgi:NADH-quinone oxidoreductase subunit L
MAEGNTVLDDAHYVPDWVKAAPFVAMLLGLGWPIQFYIRRPDLPAQAGRKPVAALPVPAQQVVFRRDLRVALRAPGQGARPLPVEAGDGAVIDGAINGLAMGIVPFFTRVAGRAQSGYIFHYAFAMVIGIALLVTWVTLTGGAQ